MVERKKRAPAQTAFIKQTPQVKNCDVLDVAKAAALLKVSKETVYKRVRDNIIPHARLGRKLLFHKQTLTQWIADGGDRAAKSNPAKAANDNQQLTLDELTGMLNNGQAKIAQKR